MIAHFVICALGGHDLLELALKSIDQYAGDSMVDLIQMPESALGVADAHGRALDHWVREPTRAPITDDDFVIVMDPDAVILTKRFIPRMLSFFANPSVGIWGAGCREDFGLRVHPMLMAIRGKVFNEQAEAETTFRPFYPDHSTREWRDTAGWYCKCAVANGWELRYEERTLGYDWHGAAAFGDGPLFVHLGGGSWSDPARMNLLQRLKNRRAIQRRRRFIREVKKALAR